MVLPRMMVSRFCAVFGGLAPTLRSGPCVSASEVDEKSARSLNGTRVASLMLELVPDADAFRLALRMVRADALA